MVVITVTIKKAVENVKTVKSMYLLRILRRIQKERLLCNITIKLKLNFYFFLEKILFFIFEN